MIEEILKAALEDETSLGLGDVLSFILDKVRGCLELHELRVRRAYWFNVGS